MGARPGSRCDLQLGPGVDSLDQSFVSRTPRRRSIRDSRRSKLLWRAHLHGHLQLWFAKCEYSDWIVVHCGFADRTRLYTDTHRSGVCRASREEEITARNELRIEAVLNSQFAPTK